MSPPIPFKSLIGTYVAPDGTPVAGQLRFVPLVTVLDPADDQVVPPQPITVNLDAGGAFTVELMCTDAAGTSPTGWVWSLDELFPGGRQRWLFQLPAAGGGVVALSDILEASPVDVTYAYASQATAATLASRLTAVEATTGTIAAAYLIHPFVMVG